MKTAEFNTHFDGGEDRSKGADPGGAEKLEKKPKRVNVDFPPWMVDALDREANRAGVSRQSVIKIWLAEKIEQINRSR